MHCKNHPQMVGLWLGFPALQPKDATMFKTNGSCTPKVIKWPTVKNQYPIDNTDQVYDH